MKKVLCLIIFTLLYVCAWGSDNVMVKGSVLCENRGVEGVWVSDGENFACTDKKGKYSLEADTDNRFVFVCVPSGYDAPKEQGVVRYFHPMPVKDSKCDFTLLRRTTDDTQHGFIAIADPQIWAEKEFAKLAVAVDDIAATVHSYDGLPFHGICSGDIVSHDHALYTQYNEVVGHSGITFRNAVGNHDMTVYGRSNETSFSKFEAMYGPIYYSYDVGQIHYVVLNNNFFIGRDYFYIGYLEEQQMRWLEKDLSHVPPGSTVVVCVHIPSSCEPQDRKLFRYERAGSTMTNHKGLYDILKPYRAHIISGHTHTTYNQAITPNLYEHVLAAVSGAWWQGELCTDGTPGGYGVFEVDGDEISWHYKSTEYPPNYQMVIYSGDEYTEFAGYVVANIWASDPTWQVEFSIDGVPCAPAERFETYDPSAKQMYSDTSLMDHKWIYPSKSDHYYRVVLPPNAKSVEVTATDPFGRMSREIKSLEKQ